MYLPPQFKAQDQALAWELVRAYPFASLISNDDTGLPFVTPLPLHLELRGEGGQQAVLLGHCAKPNPHGRLLAARPTAVVTFMGPHAYMSPSVYPDLARVPTWNYITVHCTVEARMLENFDDKDAVLKHLIGDHDPAYAAQWRALPVAFQQQMLCGITAFELEVTDVQCKLKLNQHRPEAHAAMHAAYAAGGENEQALAAWMGRSGLILNEKTS
jgi:transcriptional regulator